MNKICTDIPQSKKLIESGIDVNTADMYYMYRHWEIDENTIGSQSDASIGFDLDFYFGADNGKTYHYIPAWSLAALLSVIPTRVRSDNVLRIDKGDNDFSIWYDDINYGCVNEKLPDITTEEPIDACYEMIIKLNQQKYL